MLTSIKDSIEYDSLKKRIIIPMNDPNLSMSIRNFIEEHDGYIEVQRGMNVLQLRPEYFFSLLYLGVESDEEKEKIQKVFIKKLREKNELYDVDSILTDKEMTDLIINTGEEVLDFFEELAECIDNPLVAILKGIRKIGKVIKRKNEIGGMK